MSKEIKYEIDLREAIRIITESRAYFWLMIKYRMNPERFKNVPYEDVFPLDRLMEIFLDLDWLLTEYGAIIDAEI